MLYRKKGDNRHRSYTCGKCAHALNQGDGLVEHFCKHGQGKHCVVGVDIIPIAKDAYTQARVVEVVEVVTGAGMGAGQVTDGKTASEQMTDEAAGTEEVVIDGEKERSD